MEISLNVSILEELSSFSSIKNTLNKIGISNLELPVKLWQELEKKTDNLQSIKIIGLNNLLHSTKIFPLSIFADEQDFEEQLTQLASKYESAQHLACSSISLGIDPWVNMDLPSARNMFFKRIRKCAEEAAKKNICLTLEYISHKIARNNGDKNKTLFCPSFRDAIKLIKDINIPNVGLLLDFLHWHCDIHSPPLLELIPFIKFVHICDHINTDKEIINDSGRVLPFEGNLPLEKFLRELQSINYNGPISIEVFRNDNYTPDIYEIKKSIDRLKSRLSVGI